MNLYVIYFYVTKQCIAKKKKVNRKQWNPFSIFFLQVSCVKDHSRTLVATMQTPPPKNFNELRGFQHENLKGSFFIVSTCTFTIVSTSPTLVYVPLLSHKLLSHTVKY